MKGIDISEHNIITDYSKLKQQGIDFVIIRCGYGKNVSQKDKLFEKHYKNCKEQGLKIGCYLYSYTNTIEGAKLEAENCLNFIKGKLFDMPVYYDLEDKETAKANKSTITQIALEFCDIIEKAGYKSGVYANLNWFINYIDVNSLKSKSLWLAQYNTKPTANFSFDIWQNSSSGKVEGILGNVDTNILYKENIINNSSSNIDKGSDIKMYTYKNGSTIEPVYADSNCTIKIGSLNLYETCESFGIYNEKCIVKYKVDNTNNYKIGFVKWLGGLK